MTAVREILVEYTGNKKLQIVDSIEDPAARGVVYGVRTNILYYGDFIVNLDEGVDGVIECELDSYFGPSY